MPAVIKQAFRLSVSGYLAIILYMHDTDIHTVMGRVANACRQWETPSVTVVAEQYRTAFHVLISCIISLRTKDQVTAAASRRLFEQAETPYAMSKLTVEDIGTLIYPAGFYRNKSVQIHEICKRIIGEYNGRVPDTLEQLLDFKGVGRKTANLVVTLGHGKPGICVDIHVHRITNRWGYVATAQPDQTEMVLRQKLPGEYWIPINDLLVCYGQNRCYPVSPACSQCCLTDYCQKIGVDRSR